MVNGDGETTETMTIADAAERLRAVRGELAKVLVGQSGLVDRLLIALLSRSHLLLEGPPGVAKTLAARLFARVVEADFGRIAFTPDLLPADLLGGEIYHPATGEFSVRRGPVFTQILLADEINRAPAKVQSALLQAMQERRVTLAGETLSLPSPFLVIATQNPIEQDGTYPLPEAQLDRFLLKVLVPYPDRDDECAIVDRMSRTMIEDEDAVIEPILSPGDLADLWRAVDAVHLEPRVRDYIVELVRQTRVAISGTDRVGPEGWLAWGASPRASISLALATRAYALMEGRDFVVPHDVKSLAADVLRHRLVRTFEAEAEGVTTDQVIEKLLAMVPVP